MRGGIGLCKKKVKAPARGEREKGNLHEPRNFLQKKKLEEGREHYFGRSCTQRLRQVEGKKEREEILVEREEPFKATEEERTKSILP